MLSGAAMNVAHSDADLENYLAEASAVGTVVVISKFVQDAKVSESLCILPFSTKWKNYVYA